MAAPKLYIETPLVESYAMTKQAGCPVYLKLENTQPSYTFKLRGISNLISKVCNKVVVEIECAAMQFRLQ